MSPNNSVPSATRTIKASEFKAKCLKLMDEVAENGEEIVITKNGRPPARLVATANTQDLVRRGPGQTADYWRHHRPDRC